MDAPLVIEEDPSPDDVRVLGDGLYAFNVGATGIADGRLFGIFIRSDDGAVRAGLEGHTWGGTCEISRLWVDERHRGEGIGTRLMDEAEADARRRGCTQVFLTTHSFQAPEFYERRGYEVIGHIDEYPRGHSQLFLRKELTS